VSPVAVCSSFAAPSSSRAEGLAILDGTVVRVRLDRRATSISLLVALGVRQDGQKILLAVRNMDGESEATWRALLDELVKRGARARWWVKQIARRQSWSKLICSGVSGHLAGLYS
jgi:hypothetical protein